MNALIKQVALAVALVAPVAAFAQSNQPLTRAEVRADLVRVVQAGYNPLDRLHYPENIQAAEQRVAAQEHIAQADTSGYGSDVQSASQSGHRAAEAAVSSYSPTIYRYN
jgi:poly(3-hydroxybutyrate) depolymerase